MKNADLPAMPTHDVFQDCGVDGNSGTVMVKTVNTGLTKREYFALNAPDSPSWFSDKLYSDDQTYRSISRNGAARDSGEYLFFAWRKYYAEKMLSELERTK